MASDDDQRQVERVTSRAAVEVEVGGSSSSGTRSGVDSRASEEK